MHCGVDIGGTKIEFAVFNHKFERLTSHRIATITDNYARLLDLITLFLNQTRDKYGESCTIGVGVPGILDRSGRSFSVNVPCLNGKKVQEDLIEMVGRPVPCINDVRAFALSEANGGGAEGFETMVGVILGTGAASGFCRHGQLNLGMNGVAGEWGHLPLASTLVNKHGLPIFQCSCGLNGCIEMYVAGPGLLRLATHFLGQKMEPEECIKLARLGDVAASKLVDVWLDCVASVFAQIIQHIDPEVIVIGGGLSKISELYDRLPVMLKPHLLKGVELPVINQAVFGDDSGVRGAAILGSQA